MFHVDNYAHYGNFGCGVSTSAWISLKFAALFGANGASGIWKKDFEFEAFEDLLEANKHTNLLRN